MTSSTRYRISPEKFKNCPELEQPLVHVLLGIQTDVALLQNRFSRIVASNPLDVVVSSNTPGTNPWPLRIAQSVGTPDGVIILRAQNLSTPGSSGVPTSAVSITSQRVEANTVFIDFISGLTIGQRYRFVFGVYDAS